MYINKSCIIIIVTYDQTRLFIRIYYYIECTILKIQFLEKFFRKKCIKNNDSTKTKSDIFYKLHVVVVIVGRDNIYIMYAHRHNDAEISRRGVIEKK